MRHICDRWTKVSKTVHIFWDRRARDATHIGRTGPRWRLLSNGKAKLEWPGPGCDGKSIAYISKLVLSPSAILPLGSYIGLELGIEAVLAK
jgi:hypothetical protein